MRGALSWGNGLEQCTAPGGKAEVAVKWRISVRLPCSASPQFFPKIVGMSR